MRKFNRNRMLQNSFDCWPATCLFGRLPADLFGRLFCVLVGLVVLLACGGCSCDEPKLHETVFTADGGGGAVHGRVLLEDKGTCDEDGSIALAVRIESVERLYGGGFVLDFDPEMLEVTSVQSGEITSDDLVSSSYDTGQYTPGQLYVAFVAPDGLASGSVARIQFRPLCTGSSQIEFEAPVYGMESRTRGLVAEDGVWLEGVRWLGGRLEAR